MAIKKFKCLSAFSTDKKQYNLKDQIDISEYNSLSKQDQNRFVEENENNYIEKNSFIADLILDSDD